MALNYSLQIPQDIELLRYASDEITPNGDVS